MVTLPDSAIIDNFNFLKNTPGSNPKFSVELVELTSSQHAVVSDDGSYATGEFFQGGLRVLIRACEGTTRSSPTSVSAAPQRSRPPEVLK